MMNMIFMFIAPDGLSLIPLTQSFPDQHGLGVLAAYSPDKLS